MPMPDYSIRSAPQLQQQQGPLGALGDFAKSKALSAGLEAAFPGSGLAKEAGEAVLPALLEKGGDVEKKKRSWWQKVGERVLGVFGADCANRKRLERRAVDGDSPVRVSTPASSSRAGHGKPCLNMGGPPSKPKYSSMTDSERVP